MTKTVQKNSFLMVGFEYGSKFLVGLTGLLMAYRLKSNELGRFTAAFAFCQFLVMIADAGMGQLASINVARSGSIQSPFVRQIFTWRIISIFACWLMTPLLAEFLLPEASRSVAFWLAAAMLALGIVDFYAWLLKGLQKILYAGLLQVVSRLVLLILCVVALFMDSPLRSLQAAYLAAGVFGILLSIYIGSRSLGFFRLAPIGATFFKETFPQIYKLGSVFILGIAFMRTDLLIVAKVYGEHEAGLYAPAVYLFDALSLFSYAFFGVCVAAFSAASDKEQVKSIFHSALVPLLSVAFAAAAITFVVSPLLFASVFGRPYAPSGSYFQALVWASIPAFACQVVWAFLAAQNDYRSLLVGLFGALFANIAMNAILLPIVGPIGAPWARITGTVVLLVLLVRGCSRHALFSWSCLSLQRNSSLGIGVRETS